MLLKGVCVASVVQVPVHEPLLQKRQHISTSTLAAALLSELPLLKTKSSHPESNSDVL